MAATVTQIEIPNTYTPSDEVLLNPSITQSSFNPSTDYIEYTISTPDNSFSITDYSYNNYSFPLTEITSNSIPNIFINPESDLINDGYNSGEFNVYYNFLKNELNSSYNNQNFFIKDISSDRTEVIISNNIDPDIVNNVNNFKSQLNANPNYFQDFFLNFGGNILSVANNIEIDNDTLDIYINLYEPLPDDIQVKSTLWIVTQTSDLLAFNILFTPEIVIPTITSYPIKGPNFNLPISDEVNNSSEFQTYSTLITSSLLSTSYSQLNNLISSSGIQIGVDYTDFSNFIHFSSAVTRIDNFVYKVGLIEQYKNEITILNSLSSLVTSSNINTLTNQINNIIENFDGYEYFLYFGSGSWSYPKSTSTIPYTLRSTGSAQVINWLGDADNLTGILGSASIYDQSNLDYLYNTIPTYIQEDPQNDPYKLFVEMVAQHYDNIWIYYKDVTNRYNTDNRLDYGISKDLVANALKSFGVKLYQNNFSTNDLYSAFLGYGNPNPSTTGSLPVIANSGQEYIQRYITSSYDASVTPLDDVNKEVYKRLYHNLPYLAKTKGTIPGLKALINCFGIPDTILRISEFGGRDKDTSTYDYFDQKYNYQLAKQLDRVITSWDLNQTNWGVPHPLSVQFRFKLDPITSSAASAVPAYQSLFSISDSESNITSSLVLEYTGNWRVTASYSASTYSSSYQYANLIFYPDITDSRTASVSLPFFNNDWWSVMLNYNSSNGRYELYAGSKGYYDGYDGNQIGFLASSSQLLAVGGNWNTGTYALLSETFDIAGDRETNTYRPLSGSYQELRYWTRANSVEDFKDFIMNPSSITLTEMGEAYSNYLAFRVPLGNELYTGSRSVHPKITGSWGSYESFSNGAFGSSSVQLQNNNYTTNIESFFYDQPIAGIKNRVTDKIQIVSSSYPTGSVLSQYRSLEQTYPTLGSETPDINLLEVAFSPQNEINNDIISSLGYFNIGEYIGDPRQVSSSATTYPDLVNLSNDFFQKYFASYDLFDYIRLIKYFDNSLFKMIKDFVPARTSLASGVVIKQHLLERNKYPQPQASWEFEDYSGSIYSQQIWDENTSSSYIETSTISNIFGGTGGTFDSYNFTGSTIPPTFINNTQSWGEEVKTPAGLLTISHSTQDEFYNGELPNSIIIATDGELNPDNNIKYPSSYPITYNPVLYTSDATNESTFTNINTSPDPGEIYLWWDSGSLTNPGNTRIINPSNAAIKTLGYETAYFNSNRTNGVKYIKLNRIDSGGLDQSAYLQQLQTLTLLYPDRSSVTYNIAGIQNMDSYFMYSIGPYAPGNMNSFNTSSVGDINNFSFLATSASSFSTSFLPLGNPGEYYSNRVSSFGTITGNSLGYMTASSGIYTSGQTPNPIIQVRISGSATPATLFFVYIAKPSGAVVGDGGVLTRAWFSFPGGLFDTTFYLTSSMQIIEGDLIGFGVGTDGTSETVSSFHVSMSLYDSTPFNGSSSLTLFNPYVQNIDYNEYNPLLDNAETPVSSNFIMDVDYSQNPVIPVNQSLILEGSADRAYVQDSNYSSKSWSNIRYNGSKYNSIIIKTKPRIGSSITSPTKTNPFG